MRWATAGRLATALLVTVALGLLTAPLAAAHTTLVSTSPSDGAVLTQPPSEVSFMFDEDLLPGANVIAITDSDGVVHESVTVEPERNSVSLAWPADLDPGTYQVAYRVVSRDGHPVKGAILLTVNAQGSPPAPSPTSSPGLTSESSSDPTVDASATTSQTPESSWPNAVVILLLTSVVLVVAVLLLRTFLRRSRA